MTSSIGLPKVLLKTLGYLVLAVFLCGMFFVSIFSFMALPFFFLLAFAAFFAPGHSISGRFILFLGAFIRAPLLSLGLFAPWRALLLMAHLKLQDLAVFMAPQLSQGSFYVPYIESAYGVCGAVLSVLFGFRSLSTYIKFIRVIENLPRSMAGSAAVGLAEFRGSARSVTDGMFLLEDQSGRIRVELPKNAVWSPLDIFPIPGKTDFIKVFLARRRGRLDDGDPVYVVGTVEIEKGSSPLSEGPDRLIVRPSTERERTGLLKRLLFPEFAQSDRVEDYRNIFIVTDRPESVARKLLRRAMFTSFGMTGLFLALSLSLIIIDLTREPELRDREIRKFVSQVLKVPDETRPPWLPDFRTLPAHERSGVMPLVHIDFDSALSNKGSSTNIVPSLIETKAEETLAWKEELYKQLFPVPLNTPGVFGQSLEFGGNRSLDVVNSTLPMSSGSYTIEFWFMLKERDARPQPVMERLFTSDLFSLSIRGHGDEMIVHVPCYDESGNISRLSSYEVEIKRLMSGLTSGLWHHFKAVHDGKMLDVGINGRGFMGVPKGIDRQGLRCAWVPGKIGEIKLSGSAQGEDGFVGRIDEFYFYDYARPVKE